MNRFLLALAGCLLALPAAAQFDIAAPKCTIAAGDAQVHSEGGTCGGDAQGDQVTLTDANSQGDCGAAAGGSAGGGTVASVCIWNATAGKFVSTSGGTGGGGATTEAELESDLTDVSDVYTDNDGTLADDDVTDDDVETMATSGASGTAPVSNGAAALVMTDVATQAELDADVGDDVTDDDVESMATSGGSGTSPVSDGASGLAMTDIVTQAELDAPRIASEPWSAWAYTTDEAGNCEPPVAVTLGSGGPRDGAVVCPDNDGSTFGVGFKLPEGYDPATTMTVTLEIQQTVASTQDVDIDVKAMCRSSDDPINSTWGTEIPVGSAGAGSDGIVLTAQYDLLQATSGALTPNGSCAKGDHLWLLFSIDAAGSGADVATTNILGGEVSFYRDSITD